MLMIPRTCFFLDQTRDAQAGPFFTIEHFAGPVTYDSMSFLEKNRDTLSENVQNMLRLSEGELISMLFKKSTAKASKSTRRRGTANVKVSTSAVFKQSLLDLMDKMLKASPHFVRMLF